MDDEPANVAASVVTKVPLRARCRPRGGWRVGDKDVGDKDVCFPLSFAVGLRPL